MMVAQHPTSGVSRNILGPMHRRWCFLFGFIYYAVKGLWGPAVLSFFTLNGLYLIMPLWNRTIVGGWYEKRGWRVHWTNDKQMG